MCWRNACFGYQMKAWSTVGVFRIHHTYEVSNEDKRGVCSKTKLPRLLMENFLQIVLTGLIRWMGLSWNKMRCMLSQCDSYFFLYHPTSAFVSIQKYSLACLKKTRQTVLCCSRMWWFNHIKFSKRHIYSVVASTYN